MIENWLKTTIAAYDPNKDEPDHQLMLPVDVGIKADSARLQQSEKSRSPF